MLLGECALQSIFQTERSGADLRGVRCRESLWLNTVPTAIGLSHSLGSFFHPLSCLPLSRSPSPIFASITSNTHSVPFFLTSLHRPQTRRNLLHPPRNLFLPHSPSNHPPSLFHPPSQLLGSRLPRFSPRVHPHSLPPNRPAPTHHRVVRGKHTERRRVEGRESC